MKLQPLYNLQQEIDRLFIAGSKFAKGDIRLQKYIDQFDQLGEKIPVFKKIANNLNSLIESDPQQSADKLAEVSSLLYAILYTQSETFEEGGEISELNPIEILSFENIQTKLTYKQLSPIIQALTFAQPGRLELLKEAFKNNIFNDLRTYHYLIYALNDNYTEMVNYIIKTIMPTIGKPIIPLLINQFKYENTTLQTRIFNILLSLKYEKTDEMISKIFSEDLPNLQIASISYLRQNIKNEDFIIELTNNPNKKIREAALKSLSQLNSPKSNEWLIQFYFTKKKHNDSLLEAIENINVKKINIDTLLNLINSLKKKWEQVLANLISKPSSPKNQDALQSIADQLPLLNNKEHPEVFNLLKEIYFDVNGLFNIIPQHLDKATKEIILEIEWVLTNILNKYSKKATLSFYEEAIPLIKNDTMKLNLIKTDWLEKAIQDGYSEDKIYDTFSAMYMKQQLLQNDFTRYSQIKTMLQFFTNPKWSEIIYEKIAQSSTQKTPIHEIILLHKLEDKDSKRFAQLIERKIDNYDFEEKRILMKILMKRKTPNRFFLVFKQLDKIAQNYKTHSTFPFEWFISPIFRKNCLLNTYPIEFAEKYRKLATKYNIEYFETIAKTIETREKK